MAGQPLELFASCSRGVESLLLRELTALSATGALERKGGVRFHGDLEIAYRACLWSRLASRVFLPLSRFEIADANQLYEAAMKLDWTDLFSGSASFAVEVAGRSPAISHTHFASLRVKDAIVDRFRQQSGKRPDVDTENPDVRVHLHLDRDHADLSLDLAGDSLHRRGYRLGGSAAPLKENLAAAILVRADWPAICAEGGAVLDPMCGAGTLVIEAALMAADIAPGLARTRFAFEHWLEHKPKLWHGLREEAEARRSAGLARSLPPVCGQDLSSAAIRVAEDSARRAGLAEHVQFQVADVTDARVVGGQPGLVVANPPYGERLGDEAGLVKLYSLLGATLKTQFAGWKAAVFTARPDLGPRLGLRATDIYSLYNGPLEAKLLLFSIPADRTLPAGAGEEFSNRLRKNLKHLRRWAERENVSCYRVYDAELPDYAVAVDLYPSDQLHAHVQEYAAPKTVDPVRAERRLREALSQVQRVLELPAANIHYKLRKPQRGSAQYEKLDTAGRYHAIEEHGVKLWVNFDYYLDTGLFLDHRSIRRRLQREARGKRFLNLFCYTGAATAHAAAGGAKQSWSVDLSNTYLDWAARNLALNGVTAEVFTRAPRVAPAAPHALIRADCMEWLAQQAQAAKPPQFDLIFCDPPTFSTSKKMEGTLDVQRDHAELIQNAAKLLAPGGLLYFSTNRRGFKLNTEALAGLTLRDITAQTLDEDFKRPPPAHRCWTITRIV